MRENYVRGINDTFVKDLNGADKNLHFFLEKVRKERKFTLEIRRGYINIYYRGGNILRITQMKRKGYKLFFDLKYCLNKGDDSGYEPLKKALDGSAEQYIANLDKMMKEMDSWFKAHPKQERAFQHDLIINNSEFIVDVEYQTSYKTADGKTKKPRFDMIAVSGDKLMIIENKYGIGAISGKAGLAEHYRDICTALGDPEIRSEIDESVKNITSAKKALGLRKTSVEKLDLSKTEILFLLVDYKPNSKTRENEAEKMKEMGFQIPAKLLYLSSDEYKIDCNKAKDLS